MRVRFDADDREVVGLVVLRTGAVFGAIVGGAATFGLAWRVFQLVAGF